MNDEVNILDVVAVLKECPEEGVEKGSIGTVVEAYTSGFYEVEFSDDNGNALSFITLANEDFIVLKNLSIAA